MLIDGLVAILMAPATRRRYDLPPSLPGLLLVLGRSPLIAARELAGRAIPMLGDAFERQSVRRRESWYRRQMGGREAAFEAQSHLRR
jgi:hypothetical protein